MKQKFASRKLVIAAILLVLSVIFVFMDKATFVQWSDFMKYLFGIYATSNVAEHVSTVFKK